MANLHYLGKSDSLIDKLQIRDIGMDNISARSFRIRPEIQSTPEALFTSTFFSSLKTELGQIVCNKILF